MGFLRQDKNMHGTPVTWFKCETCGTEYSLCPAIPEERFKAWENCDKSYAIAQLESLALHEGEK